MNRWNAQIMSFAAVCEAAAVTEQIAAGSRDTPPVHLLGAVFSQEEDDLAAIFEPRAAFLGGLEHAADLLRGELRSPNPARYTVQLLKLSASLSKSRESIAHLRQLLDATPSHQRDSHRAAEIYSQTLSRLKPTIVVHGNGPRLQQPGVADGIRASLLAGVRFAWLWRQIGGKQWHLVLRRAQVLRTINELRMH